VLLVGKALSGGVVPVSAAVASSAAYEKLNRSPMLHTSTFSGNPLAAAAAKATIELMKAEDVVSSAEQLGERLLTLVKRLTVEHPDLFTEVRGRGILIGLEFKADFLAGDFMSEMMKRYVTVSYSLNAHRVVRLTPSAFLTESDLEWLENAFRESVLVLAERYFSYLQREKVAECLA
jgi:putrescine aminotransferase